MKVIKHIAKKNGKSLPASVQVSQQLKCHIRDQGQRRVWGKCPLSQPGAAEGLPYNRVFLFAKIHGSPVEYFKLMETIKLKGNKNHLQAYEELLSCTTQDWAGHSCLIYLNVHWHPQWRRFFSPEGRFIKYKQFLRILTILNRNHPQTLWTISCLLTSNTSLRCPFSLKFVLPLGDPFTVTINLFIWHGWERKKSNLLENYVKIRVNHFWKGISDRLPVRS